MIRRLGRRIGKSPNFGLVGLGAIQAGLYGVIWKLSYGFEYGEGYESRPLLVVWGLLTCLFLLYLLAVVRVWKEGGQGEVGLEARPRCRRRRLVIIFGFAILFRGILFFSQPIQEVDIYRYVWDGNVVNSGINPYRFSPQEVVENDEGGSPELETLRELRGRSDALETIFSRVHFKEVPTAYPPVSQGIFALATAVTPDQAALITHLRVMKGVLLLFDVGTMLAVWGILGVCGYPPDRVVAYAWCPLVIKELANSGHLDSIAVFMTTCAVLLLLAARSLSSGKRTEKRRRWADWAAVVLWAGGTLAKVYPIVLIPLFVRWWWRHQRWRVAGYFAAYGLLIVSGYGVINGLLNGSQPATSAPLPSRADDVAASPQEDRVDSGHGALEGFGTFLKRWEMNDLLFAIVLENVRPRSVEATDEKQPPPKPWFAVVPADWANAISQWASSWLDGLGMDFGPSRSAFLLTQGLMGGAMVTIWLMIAARRWPDSASRFLINGVFLSLAWLWYLSPTQNPWYWTWAMPFIGLAHRSWFLTSGLALIYYLRFWLMYHYGEAEVLMTGYNGTQFFDYVVVWFEHGVVLLLLAYEGIRERCRGSAP